MSPWLRTSSRNTSIAARARLALTSSISVFPVLEWQNGKARKGWEITSPIQRLGYVPWPANHAHGGQIAGSSPALPAPWQPQLRPSSTPIPHDGERSRTPTSQHPVHEQAPVPQPKMHRRRCSHEDCSGWTSRYRSAQRRISERPGQPMIPTCHPTPPVPCQKPGAVRWEWVRKGREEGLYCKSKRADSCHRLTLLILLMNSDLFSS